MLRRKNVTSTNFYRRFIRGYSQVAAPLTALTSTKSAFIWTPKAETAFLDLKKRFVSAPILVQPDPSLQFVVKADASDTGVGAILSQRSPSDHKLHPCAFFSRQLSPPERNYDVGNCELLAVKLALEEWRHWLEGAEHPFIVWTDHRNLSYIQSAKRLSSRQARWENPGTGPETILPPTCLIATLTWEVESAVHLAQRQQPDPGTGPPNRLFVRTLYGPGYWSGPIPPGSPATRESPARWTTSASDSGGPLWTQTSVPLLRRAQPALGIIP